MPGLDFESKLFNLITTDGQTDLIFSKRLAVAKAMMEIMNLFLFEQRERKSAHPLTSPTAGA